ncbi:hypothetical protein COU59_00840 [Candidatus Pacearchaeota archaeon CG10_big_fil_rev_8_21_14_0_10_34_12]|nr:MAG: hypothetical protein COU59_00840 [Candidatus Pacearchaeota archaeon CG10_big_fil_rev_8_21_14_0_10_34_12]
MKKSVMKNKKAVSNIIGYILLIAMVIVISMIVYNWLKTYVPTDAIECNDGTSIGIDSYVYDCEEKILNLTLKNNGRFDIGGYYIYGSTTSEQELATTDLSPYTEMGSNGVVLFDVAINYLSPNEKISNNFLFNTTDIIQIYSIDIVPVRYQDYNNKKIIVNCGNARISETLSCSGNETIPTAECGNSLIETGETCDDNNIVSGDGCSSTCQVESGYTCTGEPSVCVLAIADFQANYSNLTKNTGDNPNPSTCKPLQGDNWWYYDVTLQELENVTGINVNSAQKCYNASNGINWCDSAANQNAIASAFGTSHINAGSSISTLNSAWVCFNPGFSYTVKATYNGTDDNSHFVTTNYSFTVTS